MSEPQPVYQSYLLRLSSIQQDDKLVWRVLLESVRTHEQWHFANLGDYFTFLQEQEKRLLGTDQNKHPKNKGGIK